VQIYVHRHGSNIHLQLELVSIWDRIWKELALGFHYGWLVILSNFLDLLYGAFVGKEDEVS
jgi:hypothetical protein